MGEPSYNGSLRVDEKGIKPFRQKHLAEALTGCGGGAPKASPKAASEAASRLLTAAVVNDRVAFEAEIDRNYSAFKTTNKRVN